MPLHSPAGTSTPTSTRELASSRSGSTGIPYSGDHWATVNFIPPHPPTETSNRPPRPPKPHTPPPAHPERDRASGCAPDGVAPHAGFPNRGVHRLLFSRL